jgi:hypothetical protein
LRFTWLDLVEYPQRVIAVIRSAISERERALTARKRAEITHEATQ